MNTVKRRNIFARSISCIIGGLFVVALQYSVLMSEAKTAVVTQGVSGSFSQLVKKASPLYTTISFKPILR